MAINPSLLRKKQLKDPKAEELLQEFEACYKYAQETDTVLTKNLWHVYLNIARQTMLNWQNSGMNLNLTDTEFNDRLDMLKKIDDYIEASMAGELLSAKYPTGIIFYLKNAFKWADKHEPENSFNFNFDGFGPTKTVKKDDNKEGSVTSSAT